ncbi:hypothetical protein [Haloarchaeobius sp. DFWS5]|uniref:hypothetical protein n=1 Tax=Haloarchaeobius sp. DFWS5 TaxID=3446114 RepID=UPI003EB70102
MVEVGIEMLAGIAVTILLMLLFLGVVVAWDIALALRDVAEKVDLLKDEVDEDLGTIDGTLTRVHDRMGGYVPGQQARHDSPAAESAVGFAPSQGAQAATATNQVGVGRPTASGTGQTVGGFQTATYEAAAESAVSPDQAEAEPDADEAVADADSQDVDDEASEDAEDAEDEENTTDADVDDAANDNPAEDDDADGGDDDSEDESNDSDGSDGDDDDGDDPDDGDDGSAGVDDTVDPADEDTATEDDEEASADADTDDSADEDDDVEPTADEPLVADASDVDDEAIAEALGVDVSELDDLEPDEAAAGVVESFGQNARTNRRFGELQSGGDPQDDSEFEYIDALVTDVDVPEEAAESANSGRFVPAQPDEPWYRTEIDPDTVDAASPSGTSRQGHPSSDGGTIPVETPSDESESRETVAVDDPLADFEDSNAAEGGLEYATDTVTDEDEATAADESVDLDTDAEASVPDAEEDEMIGDEEPPEDQPASIGDLVDQQLESLTEAAGGERLTAEVGSMGLQQATRELDGSSYTFPLSGVDFELSATTNGGSAALRFTPREVLGLGGARERLLRYQLRKYLEQDGTGHADVHVDGDDVIVDVPAATGESVEDWTDATIRILDRTLYLTDRD